MLLGVVEENRKKEVMENLGMCAQLVEKIKRELTELEGKIFKLVGVTVKLGRFFYLYVLCQKKTTTKQNKKTKTNVP